MREHPVYRWELWGTYGHLAVADGDRLAEAVRTTRALLDRVGNACSRFLADSDLSRVNRSPERWVPVDTLLVHAVTVALEAARATDGLVDPCLGRTLSTWGYDADLHEVRVREPNVVPEPAPARGAWREIRLREDAVWLPSGCLLDLGATAKAWAADLVAATLAEQLGTGVVVSLGGDVRVAGADPWPVRVTERPDDAQGGQIVTLAEGGLATSSTLTRRWRTTSGWAHHLIDPRSGRPATEDVRTVTVTGHTCVAANTASTAALVLGGVAHEWLAERGVAARLVRSDGTVEHVGDWPAAPEGAAA